jgi:hypothetical protein
MEMGVKAEISLSSAEAAKRDICAICGRRMGGSEVKFILASKAFGQERIELSRRMACVGCYATMVPKSRAKNRVTQKHGAFSRMMSKRIAQSMMQA